MYPYTDQEIMPECFILPINLHRNKIHINKLKIGYNIINSEEEGILYFFNNSYITKNPPIVTISGGETTSRFFIKKDTYKNWQDINLNNVKIKSYELIGNKIVITGGISSVKFILDPIKLLNFHNNYNKLNKFYTKNNLDIKHNIVEHIGIAKWIYYTFGVIVLNSIN